MSVFGTMFALKAKKEGVVQSRKFFVMGMIEIIVYGVSVWGSIAAVLFSIVAMRR